MNSFQTIRCITMQEAVSFLAGRTSEEHSGHISENLTEHLDSCPACQQTLRQAAEETDSIAQLIQHLDDDFESEAAFQIARSELLQAASPAMTEVTLPLTLGQYELQSRLGQGGMGRVFRARHLHLQRTVAVKLLAPHRVHDPQAIQQFFQEMAAIGRLNHLHIVHATDAAQAEGIPFLVMEYVEGLNLSQVLRRVPELSVADACEMTRQAALGLQFAADHDLVHCDIKPSNLILSSQGIVKILDLGLARLQSSPDFNSDHITGTIDYMAPEQWTAGQLDIRTDIYGLGCTLYKLLVGRAPYESARGTLLNRRTAHLQANIPSLSAVRTDVPEALAKIVSKMLAKQPSARYAAPREVAEALAEFTNGSNLCGVLQQAQELGEETVRIPHAQLATLEIPAPAKTGRRRGWLVALGLVIFLGAIVGSLTYLTRSPPIPDWVSFPLDKTYPLVSRDVRCKVTSEMIDQLPAMRVQCVGTTHVNFGETNSDSLHFRARFSGDYVGQPGIFFALNEPEQPGAPWSEQCVRIREGENSKGVISWELHRALPKVVIPGNYIIDQWEVPLDRNHAHTLEMHRTAQGLRVLWDSKLVIENVQPDPYLGAEGYLIHGKYGVMQNQGAINYLEFSEKK